MAVARAVPIDRLRDDVRLLGELVGDVLREQGGPELFDDVEYVRQAAIGLRSGHGSSLEVETMVVDNHPDARSAASEYARFASRPSLVIAAGGGGTLRAAVEGVMDTFSPEPPAADVLRLACRSHG